MGLIDQEHLWKPTINRWHESEIEDLPESQRPLATAFYFDGQVRIDGFNTYFEEFGPTQADLLQEGFQILDADRHARLFKELLDEVSPDSRFTAAEIRVLNKIKAQRIAVEGDPCIIVGHKQGRCGEGEFGRHLETASLLCGAGFGGKIFHATNQ